MINCISIDVNRINKGIDIYRAEHKGDYPHYLIMNTESYILFEDATRIETSYGIFNKVAVWHGIPIARCEELKTGEVDFV